MIDIANYTTEKIFTIQDFRAWWREMNKKDMRQYPMQMESNDQWEAAFNLYRKYAEKL